jgi:hypothetical protein
MFGPSSRFYRRVIRPMHIIIRNSSKHHEIFGRTRSEQEVNLRKEWGPSLTDEQLDKLKYIEKKHKDTTGSTKNFIGAEDVDKLK